MEGKDYQDYVKFNIETAKLLSIVPKEKHEKVILLLNKKKEIIEKNGFLANIKLNYINRKIEKLKNR